MDENIERLAAVRVPEDVAAWLKSVAGKQGWSVSRAHRWALRETMRREYDRDLETHLRERDRGVGLAGMPPREVV